MWFQIRRLKCEKLTDMGDGHQVMAKTHMAFWPGELKMCIIVPVFRNQGSLF